MTSCARTASISPARSSAAAGFEFMHLLLLPVQLEARAICPKGVGEKNIAARVQEVAIVGAHFIGARQIPKLRGIPIGQAAANEVGAGRAIGQQPVALGKE